MYKAHFKVEIVTPVFMGGADPKKAEIRAASIKGLLRFWWRMLNGGKTIKELKEKEDKIFGSSETGKSKIRVQIREFSGKGIKKELPFRNIEIFVKGRKQTINILNYLAYGPVAYVKEDRSIKVVHEYINAGSTFSIGFESLEKKILVESVKAFYFLISLGGIGAKSRNGFGSLAVLNKEEFNHIIGEEYMSFFDRAFPKEDFNVEKSSYHSLSRYTELFKTNKLFDSWDDALAELGKIYRTARLRIDPMHHCDGRQYISSPIMEGKKQISFLDRHAKSLFLKVRKENGKFNGYILYVPYEFLEGHPKGNEQNRESYIEVYGKLVEHIAKSMERVI